MRSDDYGAYLELSAGGEKAEMKGTDVEELLKNRFQVNLELKNAPNVEFFQP